MEYEDLRIEVDDEAEQATAGMDLRVLATFGEEDRGYVVGDMQNPARLRLTLKKGGPLNRWLVVEASGFIERASL